MVFHIAKGMMALFRGLPSYVTREVSKIWRRITLEFVTEWPLLLDHWKFMLGGFIFQYVHGVGARVAHYLHRPGPLLHDVGFDWLPELGRDNSYVSETLFTFIFASFALWTFHPFVLKNKRFYTALLWYRVLMVLVICQSLRIVSFISTQLPGPNYHCHVGEPTATLPSPTNIKDVVLLNFPYGVIYGCGDLIFSSHMTFALTFCHTYNKYGTKRWVKKFSWVLMIALSFLIIASRKHYSVDVVVAWYVVYLVFDNIDRRLADAELLERVPANTGPMLPLNMRAGKDSRNKEEKMMNGNSENRQRTPLNGKVLDDGSPTTMEPMWVGGISHPGMPWVEAENRTL